MRHPTAAKRAFTMVEMLVVISIIVLLVALGLLAYAHIDRATVMRATRADLQIAQGFLDEYNAGPGISQLGLGNSALDPTFPYKGGDFPSPTLPNNNAPIGGTTADAQTNVWTGNVSLSGDQRIPSPNTAGPSGEITVAWDTAYNPATDTTHNAVYNTGQVMVFLMRLPAVAQTVSKIPSTKLLTFPSAGGKTQLFFTAGANGNLSSPILLDGWGNPIIFVPAGGLVTKVSGTPNGAPVLVRSSGTIVLTGGLTAKSPPPLKDNDHPFWASAGPDGDFYGGNNTNGGDDNIYSFQQ